MKYLLLAAFVGGIVVVNGLANLVHRGPRPEACGPRAGPGRSRRAGPVRITGTRPGRAPA